MQPHDSLDARGAGLIRPRGRGATAGGNVPTALDSLTGRKRTLFQPRDVAWPLPRRDGLRRLTLFLRRPWSSRGTRGG